MKKNNKKLVSALAVLAITATSAFGSLSFAACGDKQITGDTGVSDFSGGSTYTISTVFGSREVATSGNVYYISPDGNGDGSAENPADLIKFLDGTVSSSNTAIPNTSIQPGDTVILKNGTYTLNQTLHLFTSGTYDMPITIKAETAGRVTLSCYGQTWGVRGVQLEADYVNFIGINVCGSGDNGLYLSGDHDLVENCEFYDNRDTGLQIGRYLSINNTVNTWPSYNLVKNCSSHNNYDNQTYGENADGFAAKLTLGYGNVFDGCIAYRNSDDGWDLYAKNTSGNLGAVMIYNCVAFENGFLEYTQEETNARFGSTYDHKYDEANTNTYTTSAGDGNGFKLGGEAMEGDVFVYNCLSFGNRMHGFTDNSNPGFLSISYCTAVDNGALINDDADSEEFGQIINPSSTTSHDNFDISRQTYSYNHLDHSLSIKSTDFGGGLVYDKVRGSVQDSILYGTASDATHAYTITGSLDADTKNGITGTAGAMLTASDIFEQVQIVKTETLGEGENAQTTVSYQFNLTGLGRYHTTESVHSMLRNADGSINMGSLYQIKDYTKLLGNDNKIGAVLTGSSYEDYTHYNMTDFTNFTSEVDVRLQSAKDMLYIETDATAVYQDFEAVSKIYDCNVMWESSDPSIISVTKDYTGSALSKAEYVPMVVTRPSTDTEVTLTATIVYYGKTIQKQFVLNVKGDSPKIGDITVIGPDGNELANGESIIVDKYAVLSDPEMIILNAADYNGKTITADQATFTTTYEFGEDIAAFTTGKSIKVKGFTTAQDGAFKITMSVKLNVGANKGATQSFVYYVVVASNTANVKFLNDDYTVVVNANGYNISGSLTSAIGTVYSYSTATQLADENKTAAFVKANGTAVAFRTTTLSQNFANKNEGAYYIYTVFANGNGEFTSDVYETKVDVVEISTEQAFFDLAQNNIESVSTKIYALTKDLDFTDFTWHITTDIAADQTGFSGMFNGNGHTISNITITATKSYAGVFRSLFGGTVTNVKFNNVSVAGYAEKVGGIFGAIISGSVSNIEVTNITVLAKATIARIGGFVGQIFSNDNPVEIKNISIVNDISANQDGSYTYQIGGEKASERIGGLVGFAQTSSAQYYMNIAISNCYVQAIVGGNTTGDYTGGILGRYDDRNGDSLDHLSITGCYVNSVIMGAKRTAGIFGGGTYTGNLHLDSCAFVGTVLNGSGKVVTSSNSSNASVLASYSLTKITGGRVAAYFTDNTFKTTTTILTADSIKLASTWEALGFDLTVWTLNTTTGTLTLNLFQA